MSHPGGTPERNARPAAADPLSGPYFGLSLLVGVLAFLAALVAVVYATFTALDLDPLEMEVFLALIVLSGRAAVNGGEAIGVGLVLLAISGWRFYRHGYMLDAGVVAMPIAIVVIVLSVLYAHAAAKTRTARHAQQMIDAVEQGDRKRLREIVFECRVFCGFDQDSGPLVWLVNAADSTADMNAIGRILQTKAARNVRSGWLADRRTPLEVAVDRYATRSTLAPYVLGVSKVDFHFPVRRASAAEMDATLLYAIRQRASPMLIQELLKEGADPRTVLNGTSAIETATMLGYEEALAEIHRTTPMRGGR